MFKKIGTILIGCAFSSHSIGLAGMRAPVPVTVLAQQADVVALATIDGITGGGPVRVTTLQLRLQQTLKGQPGALNIRATITPPSPDIASGMLLPKAFVGQVGLWFLKGPVASGSYEIVPTVKGLYAGNRDLFFPLDAGVETTQFSGTLNQEVLACLVRWYQSLPSASVVDDDTLLKSLDAGLPGSAAPADLLAAIIPLRGSVYVAQQIVGLAAAIPLGDDQALPLVVSQLASLESNPKFPLITRAIRGNTAPLGSASTSALAQLVSVRSAVPGLEAAAGAALARLGTTASALPAMASLLDSSDPEAQLRAAAYFARFTLFADASGQVKEDHLIGPWATQQTRQFTPRNDSGITPAQYAQYWQGWWSQNKHAFGF